jgi:uncharacterized protein YdhG (YjbR/CyaY superfamily)
LEQWKNYPEMTITKRTGIDEYIARFPEDTREILEEIRATIKKAAPGAEETIKYKMPAFLLNGDLVYFAAFKNHIGFYPAPVGNKDFEQELSLYNTGKGSVQFPLGKAVPLKFITKIVKFRMKKNLG